MPGADREDWGQAFLLEGLRGGSEQSAVPWPALHEGRCMSPGSLASVLQTGTTLWHLSTTEHPQPRGTESRNTFLVHYRHWQQNLKINYFALNFSSLLLSSRWRNGTTLDPDRSEAAFAAQILNGRTIFLHWFLPDFSLIYWKIKVNIVCANFRTLCSI